MNENKIEIGTARTLKLNRRNTGAAITWLLIDGVKINAKFATVAQKRAYLFGK